MKKLFSIIIVLLFGLQINAQQKIKDVDSIILREMQERKIPGLQIAVVDHGKIALCKSYGIANIQDSIAVTNQSVFALNSITKVFTGVSVMQLVERGKLDLTLPVSHYLDIFPKNWDTSITIKHLLTHTSGLPDLLKILDPNTGGVGILKTEDAVWEKLKMMPMDFIPGEKFAYNQTNAYLLGKLVDKLSETPFTENFAELQFKPAGMKHTVFGDSRDVISHFAPTYFWRKNRDGRLLENAQLINNYELS